MSYKTRLVASFIIGLLSISMNACDRSSSIVQPSVSMVHQQTLQTSQPVSSVPVETSSSDWTQMEIQVKLIPCQPDITVKPAEPNKAWKPLKPNQALGGIASISTGIIFDAAGYGWKPGISYAISKEGFVWYWGYKKQNVVFPQLISDLEHVEQISGDYALTTDGQVWMLKAGNSPTKVIGLNEAAAIQQLGEMNPVLFILKQDGTLWQLDLEPDQTVPEPLSSFKDIQSIYGSEFSLFVLDEAGKLSYLDGRSGGSMVEKDLSSDIPDKISQIAVGYDDQALIQTINGKMYTFSAQNDAITRTPNGDNAKRMAVVGNDLFLIAKLDGSVWGWGMNQNGILGENQSLNSDEPIRIEGLKDIVDVQAGTDHALALDSKGFVYSWGSNMTGQLGRIQIIFDQWQEMGTLDGIQEAITELDKPYFIREDGSVWSLEADRSAYKVDGLSNIRLLTSMYGLPITLGADGMVRVWSNQFTSCQALSVPFEVKHLVAGDESIVLQSGDNHFLIIKVKPELDKKGVKYVTKSLLLEKSELIQTDGDWSSQVKSLSANQYTFFALTDDGRLYYLDEAADLSKIFKPIAELQGIKELAPEFNIHYTAEASPVWALNETGSVYEIIVNPVKMDGDQAKDVEVSVGPEKEDNIAAISGTFRITKVGDIFEKYIFDNSGNPFQRQLAPDPIKLISSNYQYANEGPGSYYHLLVTSNDKVVIIGYNPFGGSASSPDKVVIP